MRRLIVALTLLVTACGSSPLATKAAPPDVRRVVATPIPTPTPTPAPTAKPVLTNPGGGIRWVPSLDAGPWPTDGVITLPTLARSAPIVRVGVDRHGEMVVPKNARDVAWLDQGPFPGDTNNGVLAGHKNWAGRSGTFDHLGNLKPGDPVVVAMSGRTWTFHVTWVQMFDPETAPVQQIMGLTDVPSVTLTTCGGTFDRRVGHYRSRVIARAELVSTV